jgi:hypothetical protein
MDRDESVFEGLLTLTRYLKRYSPFIAFAVRP